MKKRKAICSLFFALLIQSCTMEKPTKDEIIGSWSDSNGAVIEFKRNGSFEGRKLSVYAFYENDTIDSFDAKGIWEIKKENGKWFTDLTFKEKSIYQNKIVSINSRMFITGNGFFGNKRPLHIYLQVGDPDEDDRYEFFKKED